MNDQSKPTEKKQTELTKSQKLFRDFIPWFGAIVFVVCAYFLLVKNQEIPWYIFAICGALMGLGRELVAIKDLKP